MDSTYRKERIDRLLHELKYEIMRGMMEREQFQSKASTLISTARSLRAR